MRYSAGQQPDELRLSAGARLFEQSREVRPSGVNRYLQIPRRLLYRAVIEKLQSRRVSAGVKP